MHWQMESLCATDDDFFYSTHYLEYLDRKKLQTISKQISLNFITAIGGFVQNIGNAIASLENYVQLCVQ